MTVTAKHPRGCTGKAVSSILKRIARDLPTEWADAARAIIENEMDLFYLPPDANPWRLVKTLYSSDGGSKVEWHEKGAASD